MATELTVAQLSTWLSEQSENTPDTPYEINLTDVTNTNITYIKSYLQANPTKYVNLSPTYITNYSMSLSYLFENCTTLIESPRFSTPTFGLHPSMYAAFRGCTNLKYGYILSGTQDASNAFQGCTSLISFPGGITSSLRDISYFCYGCTSLQSMPYLPDVTNMEGAFRDCTSLTSITNIPSSIRNIAYAFKGCTGITSAPDIPYGITSLESTFEGCTALEECGSIANSVTNFTKTFKGCSSMTTFPDISSNGSIGIMEGTFEGCTGITTFSFPLSVRNVKNCFKGVTSLETVNNMPSGITNAESCFEGCTSLETINLFSIPLNTIKNNTNFKDMFKGCTSLTSIGSAVEESDDWHIFYFKVLAYPTYGGINGRIYDREGNYTEVSYYNYFNNINMLFFQLTDELWFPPNLMLDADVYSVIQKVISKKVSYFNKEVVDPEKKTFIMYADNPEEVHTNLKLGGGITVYDTEEEMEEDLPNKQDGDLVGTLSADEGELQDAPLGSVMSYLGNTDPSDGKWLICDGRDTTGTAIELETHYPSLYMFLGGTNVLPNLNSGNDKYIIKATSSVDVYHAPASEIAQIEQYFDNGLQNAESYSTTETLTGGTWIDGKPIYRKVITGTWTSGQTLQVSYSMTDNHIAEFVSFKIRARNTNDGLQDGYYSNTSDYFNFIYRYNTQKFELRRGSSYPSLPLEYYLIIEYTKTTD